MQTIRARLVSVVALGVVIISSLGLVGCGGGGIPSPTPTPTPAPSVPPIPTGGVSLRLFGIDNGPPGFSVPLSSTAANVVDQANNVVLVLTAPAPADVSAYLRRALPESGFRITADDPDLDTINFTGQGWTGSFTSTDRTSAILLRPL